MLEGKLGGEARDEANTSPEATAAAVTDKIAKRGLHKVEKKTSRLERLVVEYVSVDDVRPNTYNPNRQDEATLELLCRSMKEDGFTQPIIVHRSSGQIVDGEHRWRAARKMDMTQIPIVYVDMTDEQMKIATLRHNRARGSEDIDLSSEVIRDLQQLGALDWAQDSLMMSDNELNDLFADESVCDALAGDDYVDAWVPERGNASDDDDAGEAGTEIIETTNDSGAGTNAIAMTKSAALASTERKQALANATTETERTEIASKNEAPFRLALTFTGDEADLMKSVLGNEPATELLKICTEELAKMEETEKAV